MRINPIFPEDELDPPVEEVLEESGVLSQDKIDETDPNAILKSHFNSVGGTLKDVAQQVADIMCRGETEASRLRAAEFISKIHGVQAELDEKPQSKEVTINIINSPGSESRNLMQFVMPKA